MKKILILLLPVMLWSCGNEKKQIPVVEYVNGLVEMYPNYRSNEAAEASLLDSIANHNHTTKDLEGVEFRFEKLIENPQTGERSAIFTSIGCTSDIEVLVTADMWQRSDVFEIRGKFPYLKD